MTAPTPQESQDMRDLAGLVVDINRRMAASYGTRDEWRRDITQAVQIMERANLAMVTARTLQSEASR